MSPIAAIAKTTVMLAAGTFFTTNNHDPLSMTISTIWDGLFAVLFGRAAGAAS
jgi:hypothetical protein